MNKKNYQRKVQQQASQMTFWFALLFYIFGLSIIPIHQTWQLGIGTGTFFFLLFITATFLLKNIALVRALVGFAFAGFVLQFIAQLHALQEAHYIFFIGVAILVLYQDVRIFLSYGLIIVAHHSIFYYLLLFGFPIQDYFIQLKSTDITPFVVAFHLGAMFLMTLMGMGLAYLLHHISQQHYQSNLQAEEKLKALETSLDWIIQISEGELNTTNDQVLHSIIGGHRLIDMKHKLAQAKNLEEKEKSPSPIWRGVWGEVKKP